MKESDLNRRAMSYVAGVLVPSVYYKIADKFTRGIPDSVFTWDNCTSWLEFKLLDPNESIHDQLDPAQLVELVRLQRACNRAWVVAFRRANVKKHILPRTVFYAPMALLGGRVPTAHETSKSENILRDLRVYGVAECEGFDYKALAELIRQTHSGY